MTSIGPNNFYLYFKLIFQVVLFALLALPIYDFFTLWNNYKSITDFTGLVLMLVFIIFISAVNSGAIFLIPYRVIIDSSQKIISLKYLFKKWRAIQLKDIENYSTTIIHTKGDKHQGVIVHLQIQERILLSNYNLKDFKPVLSFLGEESVEYIGDEKFKAFAYYKQYL